MVRYENNNRLSLKRLFMVDVTGIGEKNGDNYGPYMIDWETFETCKGPKKDNCGQFEVTNVQNMSDIIFLLDFHKDCPTTMGKIVVSTRSKNVTKRLWNYVLNRPCEHFVLGPILISSFNLTKECKIYKGKYEIHLDLEAKTKVFLGENFFYGNYTFLITSYNKVNNFFCYKTNMAVKKIA
ncbi:unnamed protein product [Arctia plantaginis]|uniref:Uncharacterized protein n=1 Tax=Arctia plantaginis TaxID=874455 RepID=A0A8S0ZDI5_ARCPL|nr:unnamed protein product [Arctia plantaginis]